MQLTTTVLKHKRYSTYGWQVRNEDNSYKNTLAQGEFGILLGHEYLDKDNNIIVESINQANTGKELNCVLEVRIGTKDNQYFFDAMIINSKDNIDYSVRTYDTPNKLPSFGNANSICIVKSNNTLYRWDDATTSWIPIMSGNGQNGGCQCDLSNYYTKDQIDSLLDTWVNEILNIEMIDGGAAIVKSLSSITI